jgi:prophage regulatory protein
MQIFLTAHTFLDFMNHPSDLMFESGRDLPSIAKVLSKFNQISNQMPFGGGGGRELARRKTQSDDSQAQNKSELRSSVPALARIGSDATNDNQNGQSANIAGRERLRILRLREVLGRVGLSRSSVYKFISEGKFPKQVSLGARAVGFYEHEIDLWINQLAGA